MSYNAKCWRNGREAGYLQDWKFLVQRDLFVLPTIETEQENGEASFSARSLTMPLPNSLPWMESADAKMIRAHENIEGIAREINEWFASIEFEMYLKTVSENQFPWLVIHATDY